MTTVNQSFLLVVVVALFFGDTVAVGGEGSEQAEAVAEHDGRGGGVAEHAAGERDGGGLVRGGCPGRARLRYRPRPESPGSA